jgi:geranylgeranyl diphosphate synthase type I
LSQATIHLKQTNRMSIRLEEDMMENEKLAEKALKILSERSGKALELTKKAILEEKMGKRADEALKYYVKKWDDITRPGVLSLACEAVGGSSKEVVPLQIALLFIAATMDIHDDVIDKSVAKITGQTLYGKFGEETALLLGNAILVKGFNHLYKAIENLPHERRSSIVDNTKDFLFEVISAHIREVELRDKKWSVKPEVYLRILEEKAADIEGHMRIGAIFGGGSSQEIKALSKYGRCLGILLLVRSDFVDLFEPNELMNRVRYECLPLPVLYALQNEVHKKKLCEILSGEEIDENKANELSEIIYKTSEISHLKRHLNILKKEAVSTLRYLRPIEVKDSLRLIALSTLEDL